MSKLVSKQCIDFIKSFEGFSATPYLDCVGVRTLGYGMTGKEIEGLSYVTEEQASIMLEDLLNNKYATPLKSDLDSKGVKLNQNQFDALVSMAYNIGVSGVLGSTLYKNICNGVRDVATITANFTAWSKAGGKTLPGLLRRRQREAAMFFSNDNTVQKEEKKVENIVVYNYGPDQGAAEYLANYLNCPVITNSRKFDFSCVKNVYAVGGKKEQYSSYVKQVISGTDQYETMKEVLHFCGKLW